jgi:hypothetical protein
MAVSDFEKVMTFASSSDKSSFTLHNTRTHTNSDRGEFDTSASINALLAAQAQDFTHVLLFPVIKRRILAFARSVPHRRPLPGGRENQSRFYELKEAL